MLQKTSTNGEEIIGKAVKVKNLGIWMDHSNAHLMEFTTDPITTDIISSKFTHEEKEHSLSKGENLMHNTEQHQRSAYYKRIADVIRNYEDVIIFGPTDAKSELLNLLRADHNFENIKLTIEQTDKMTQNQQHAFVKEYFSKRELR
jgi:Lhr-like helicase